MHVHWLDLNDLDQRDVDGVAAVFEAVRVQDSPHESAVTARTVRAGLTHGWELEPAPTALARTGDHRVIGVLRVRSSEYDNQHVADVEVAVDPAHRRRGLGRQLFELGVERAVADGRTLVTAACWDNGPGVGFAKAMGLDRASEEVKRAQDLWSLDWDRLEALTGEAAAYHTEYEFVLFGYPTAEELLGPIAEMTAAINDAPTDDLDVEDEVFTPARIRAHEQAQFAHERRMYRLVARHRPSGELAGHTVVAVPADQPWHAHQFDTSVVRTHRGHRLGLGLKIAMLRVLAREEPQARALETWNAASNDHMIGVNEALGYRVVARAIDWQKHL